MSSLWSAVPRWVDRLLVRNRGWVRPWWVNAGYLALIVPADHVMATGMLRGLKRRVEAAT